MMQKLSFVVLLSCITFTASLAQKQFWGSCSAGGLYGDGFIFRTDSIGNDLEIVHHFQNAVDGKNISALMLASNNKLYGMASSGGLGSTDVFSSGTFFEYDLTTEQFRVLEHFGPNNTHLPGVTLPRGEGARALTEVSPGVIFGLMRQGKYVFSYNVATGVFTNPFTVPSYQGGPTNTTLQNQLGEAFYKASDNFLYAGTFTNSSCPIANPNMGSIIRVNPATNAIEIRHRASCLVGNGFAYNGFFAEANGKLYGTTDAGGANSTGVIFAYNPADNTYTKVHDFPSGGNSFEPTSLVLANNGKLYGTAHGGGIVETNLPTGGGVLFEFDITTGAFTKKHSFTIAGQSIYDMGIFPSGLISGSNGKLYGATQYGVFEYDPVADVIRVAGRFVAHGFAPSLVEVCRKPVYQTPSATTYTLCKDAAFTLDLASTNATTVTWTHNTIADASKTTATLNVSAFTAADAGTWECTLVNECGTTVAPAITLVLDEPAQPVIEPAGPVTVCEGETVTLSAPAGFDSYAWSNGETTREIEVSQSGDYSVKVNDGCEGPASDPVSVTVHPLPPAPELVIVPESGGALTASGSPGTYAWTWNDQPLDEQGADLQATEDGTYKVYSISTEGCRSHDFASFDVIVNATETTADNSVVIYPNPNQGTVNLKVNNNFTGQADLLLFNVTGAVVFRQSVTLRSGPNPVHFKDVPAGLYDLMIRKAENVIHRKFVIF